VEEVVVTVCIADCKSRDRGKNDTGTETVRERYWEDKTVDARGYARSRDREIASHNDSQQN
jgi:hypothetical protein